MVLKCLCLDDTVQNVFFFFCLNLSEAYDFSLSAPVSFFSHYSFSSEWIWQLSSGRKVKHLHKNQFPVTQSRRIYIQEENSSFLDIKLSELSSTRIFYFLLLSVALCAASHSLVGISDISKLHALWRHAGEKSGLHTCESSWFCEDSHSTKCGEWQLPEFIYKMKRGRHAQIIRGTSWSTSSVEYSSLIKKTRGT